MDRVAEAARVEGRLGDVDAARLEHGTHVLMDQREEQTSDVAAVDVGIAQDHDPSVAGGLQVEIPA